MLKKKDYRIRFLATFECIPLTVLYIKSELMAGSENQLKSYLFQTF